MAIQNANVMASSPTSNRGSQIRDAPVNKVAAVAAAPVSLPKTIAPFAPVAPVAPVMVPTPAPVQSVQQSQPASITVKLPQGATLYVDDRKNPSTESVRKFTTPPLPAGREFGYLLKVEVTRNGMPETLTQKVAFRAGEQVTVDMTSLGGR